MGQTYAAAGLSLVGLAGICGACGFGSVVGGAAIVTSTGFGFKYASGFDWNFCAHPAQQK